MRAWEVHDGVLAVRDVPDVAAGPGESVVTVSQAGVCGSDLPKLRAPRCFDLPERWRPGHEIVGTVAGGTLVALDPLVPCGLCEACPDGRTHLCAGLRRIGWDLPGGLAEQVVAPVGNLHSIAPEDASVAVLADPMAVAIHGLRCSGLGRPGRLAVVGAGTVGLLTAAYGASIGWDVTVVHRGTDLNERAASVDARLVSLGEATTSTPYDVVVDAASGSSPAPLALALELVRDGGTVVVQNAYHPGVRLGTPLRDIFRRSVRLVGSFSFCRRGGNDFGLALAALASSRAVFGPLLVGIGGLEALESTVDRAEERRRLVVHLRGDRATGG